MPSNHELILELQGTQLIVTALLLEINRPFHVTDAKLAEATKWHVDAEVTNGIDILFLTPKVENGPENSSK